MSKKPKNPEDSLPNIVKTRLSDIHHKQVMAICKEQQATMHPAKFYRLAIIARIGSVNNAKRLNKK